MRFRLAALLALLALPALAEPPRVVADIAPVQSLLAQVMAGVAEPALLVDQDANPHAVQLRPSQARMLADAELLVWVGPGLTPWLEDAAAALTGADQIVLMNSRATHLRRLAPDEVHADEQSTDDHDHGALDPHVWLAPDNAHAWLGLFAEALAARDPEHAATYRANAAAAQAALDTEVARLATRLAPHRGAEIVTFHAAFGYFAERFGLAIVGSVRPSDATSPSAAALAQLRTLVADHGVRCAFTEPAFDPALLEALAGETGLTLGALDATGALQAPGPGQYTATLGAIGDAIADCLDNAS